MRARLFGACVFAILAAACTGSSSSIEVSAPSSLKCQVTAANALNGAAPSGGTTSTITITTTRDCTWTASSEASWIAITSEATGQGSGSIAYRVNANADPAQRRGTLDVNNSPVTIVQDAAPCRFSVTPRSTSVSAAGGAVSLNVDTLTGCGWTATSDAGWISVGENATGARAGTVTVTVAANAGGARSGTVKIADQSATINQAALPATPSPTPTPPEPAPPEPAPPAPAPPTPAPPTPTPPAPPPACSFAISPARQAIDAEGGTGSIAVTAGPSCAWTATEDVSWISITSGTSGTANGTVAFRVNANSGAARTATLTVAGKTFTVNQAAAPPPPPACTYSINATSQNVGESGGTGSVAVTTSAPSCAWTAEPNASWVTVTSGASGTGNGTVAFSVASNTGPARTTTLTVAGKTFTINQAAAAPPPPACTFTIAPTSQNVADTASTSTFAVTASSNTCTWTATANVDWLTITSGSSGSGNGNVSFSVAANAGAARTGTITAAGQTFTVTQAAPPPPCTFTIAPVGQNVPDTAGSGSVAVTASAASCAWTATPNADWLAITAGASGTGSGTTNFSFAANTGAARTGTMTIAGQTFTVSQSAPPPPPASCAFSISPTSQTMDSGGGRGNVALTASAPMCAWTASSRVDWIAITSAQSGTGSASVAFDVGEQKHDDDRTGTLTIASQVFTLTQRGSK